MSPRVLAAAFQVAAFVGGGLVCPVLHLASHGPDHTHGPEGPTLAFDLPIGLSEAPRPPGGVAPSVAPRSRGHRHAHVHSHPHPHAHPHTAVPPHPAPPEPEAPATSSPRGEAPGPAAEGHPPFPPGHGHGSLAHFGLALLSAPPPLALLAPEPAAERPLVAHVRVAALQRPSFPLPRPPPARASA